MGNHGAGDDDEDGNDSEVAEVDFVRTGTYDYMRLC